MQRQIILEGKTIEYDLQYKKVKNINLCIKPDCSVSVSASRCVSVSCIEAFIISKSALILKALKNYEKRDIRPLTPNYAESVVKQIITDMCEKVYPYYQNLGIKYPQIKFRKMTSRWGSCHAVKGILTFNTNLMYAPLKSIEYVVWHEFTHFLQPNHSAKFYEELEKVMPDWKKHRKKLNEIHLK